MASNNYISANVVPSSDTFREWVDLTNRITFDMSDKVVTTAKHSVGGGTTGNAYVNGIFSANTLIITDSIKGGTTDDSSNVVGANTTSSNLSISTNTVFVNSFASVTSNTIVNAFSIAEGQFVYQANSTANQVAISTSNQHLKFLYLTSLPEPGLIEIVMFQPTKMLISVYWLKS